MQPLSYWSKLLCSALTTSASSNCRWRCLWTEGCSGPLVRWRQETDGRLTRNPFRTKLEGPKKRQRIFFACEVCKCEPWPQMYTDVYPLVIWHMAIQWVIFHSYVEKLPEGIHCEPAEAWSDLLSASRLPSPVVETTRRVAIERVVRGISPQVFSVQDSRDPFPMYFPLSVLGVYSMMGSFRPRLLLVPQCERMWKANAWLKGGTSIVSSRELAQAIGTKHGCCQKPARKP